MTNFSITFTNSSGQSETINFNEPATTILAQIFHRLCQTKQLDPNSHALKFQKKKLDLSLTLALSNLPPNAKLNLVKEDLIAPKLVQVVLQLPTGERLQTKILSSTSLWETILSVEQANQGSNLTRQPSSSSSGSYLQPILYYMNKPQKGFDHLSNTTLAAIGIIDGSALMRVTFEEPLTTTASPAQTTSPETQTTTIAPTTTTSSTTPSPETQTTTSKEENQEMEDLTTKNKAETSISSLSSDSIITTTTSTATLSEVNPETPLSSVNSSESTKIQATPPTTSSIPTSSSSSSHSANTNTNTNQSAVFSKPSKPQTSYSELMPFRNGFSFDNFVPNSNSNSNNENQNQTQSRQPQTQSYSSYQAQPQLQTQAQPQLQTQAQTQPQPQPQPQTNFSSQQTSSNDSYRLPSRLKSISTTRFETPQRNSLVFRTGNRQLDPRQFELPDDFYEFTEEDARRLLVTQAEKQKKEASQMLKTKAMRESELVERALAMKKALIRFSFPGKLLVQAQFHPLETISSLYDFISSIIESPKPSFYLFITPPVQKLDDMKSSTLIASHLAPHSIVHVKFIENDGILIQEVLNTITDLPEYQIKTTTTTTTKSSSSQSSSSSATTTTPMEINEVSNEDAAEAAMKRKTKDEELKQKASKFIRL